MKQIDKVVFKTPREQINALVTEMEELRIQLNQERQDHGAYVMDLKRISSEMLKGKDEQIAKLESAIDTALEALTSGRNFHSAIIKLREVME